MFEHLKFPKVERKVVMRNRKKSRKYYAKIKKFAKRPYHYVVATGETKCLDCGWQAPMHRLGCGVCQLEKMVKGVIYGAVISQGDICTSRKKPRKPFIGTTEFISYQDLLKRIREGDRIYCISQKRELSVKDFIDG
ncbi:hypothetical protein WCE14_09240 [Acinetobacter schindleri]|uniref:hypothetical protein n=1 Tax=Acinetobacter schindleri TaxID=108981 RepID=UPI0034D5B7E0